MLASSAFSILWFLCGLTAVLTMLSMLGTGKVEGPTRSTLKWTHRIFGGIFSIGYLIFAALMIPKYHANAPLLSSPIATHAYVAILIFPLLLFKHYIVRVAKKYFQALPYIGMTILILAFLVVAMTGLNHIILWTKVPKMTVQSASGPRIVSTAIGRNLLPIKCARCHDLIRLYEKKRNEEAWRKTIQRMHDHDKALVITQDQVDHLAGYLLLKE
jgi:hypothetical protein